MEHGRDFYCEGALSIEALQKQEFFTRRLGRISAQQLLSREHIIGSVTLVHWTRTNRYCTIDLKKIQFYANVRVLQTIFKSVSDL